MTTASLKKKIQLLLSDRNDKQLLEEIHSLLEGNADMDALRNRIVQAVEAGEADIRAGRTVEFSAFERHMKAELQKKIRIRGAKGKGG